MGVLDRSRWLLRAGAGALAGALRLSASALREVAHLVDVVAGEPSPQRRRDLAGTGALESDRGLSEDGGPVRASGPPAAPEVADAAARAGSVSPAAEPVIDRRPRAKQPAPAPRSREAPGETAQAGGPAVPAHVAAEEELVAELADSGAEEGAGAEVHVAQPWPGYDSMRARDVLERLSAESPEVLSVVLLHEQANRRRRTVIEAARRALARHRPEQAGRRRPA